MLVLNATTDNVQVVLNAAHTTNPLRCCSCWRDVTTTAYTPGRTVTNTNGATDVNLVPAPGASTQRVADYLSVYNSDTAAKTVTIKFDDNGTEYTLWSASLGVGETLIYADAIGFQVLSNDGSLKILQAAQVPDSTQLSTVLLGSDVINNNASANTIADVTGLSFAVTAGKTYYFRFVIPYTAAATTTGSRWAINGPGAPTLIAYHSRYTITATTETVNHPAAYDTPAASNASSLTAGNVAVVEGIIIPSADGTVIARFASEISSSAITAKAGAVLHYQQLN